MSRLDTAPSPPEFPGFPDMRANVTFVPLQFFTVVVPHRSQGCVRLVGYILRQLLGWVDADGNPKQSQIQFTYSQLGREAGISRDRIAGAIKEALDWRLIRCVKAPRTSSPGQAGSSGIYTLNWSDHYTDAPAEFLGFFQREAVACSGPGTAVPIARAARKNIPNAFFDYVLRRERLAVIRVVGTLLFKSIEWGRGGERKVPVTLSITQLARLTGIARRHVQDAVNESLQRGYIGRIKPGRFDPHAGAESRAATYRVRWTGQSVNPVFRSAEVSQYDCTHSGPIRSNRNPPPLPKRSTLAAEHPSAPSAPYPFPDRSEKGNGSAVRKGARESEKGHGSSQKRYTEIGQKRDTV